MGKRPCAERTKGPHRHRPSPEGTVGVARAGVVSWLRDRRTRLPDLAVSGLESGSCLPLQWRGRTGVAPVSVAPARHMNCGLNLCRRFAFFNRLRVDQPADERGAPRAIVLATGSGLAPGVGVDEIKRRDLARQCL